MDRNFDGTEIFVLLEILKVERLKGVPRYDIFLINRQIRDSSLLWLLLILLRFSGEGKKWESRFFFFRNTRQRLTRIRR